MSPARRPTVAQADVTGRGKSRKRKGAVTPTDPVHQPVKHVKPEVPVRGIARTKPTPKNGKVRKGSAPAGKQTEGVTEATVPRAPGRTVSSKPNADEPNTGRLDPPFGGDPGPILPPAKVDEPIASQPNPAETVVSVPVPKADTEPLPSTVSLSLAFVPASSAPEDHVIAPIPESPPEAAQSAVPIRETVVPDPEWVEGPASTQLARGASESIPPEIEAPERMASVPKPIETSQVRGMPSQFLEERMEAARKAASGVHQEIDEMERRSRDLRGTIATIERELDRATRELAYVRSVYGGDMTSHQAPAESQSRDRSDGRSDWDKPGVMIIPPQPTPTSPARRPASGRFVRFTVGLYNRAIDDLKRRRRRMAILTILLSGLIGAAVVTLTLIYGEPNTPLWVAILPAVWLVPVPFFVIAFRGTHRLLKENHLTLPGEP